MKPPTSLINFVVSAGFACFFVLALTSCQYISYPDTTARCENPLNHYSELPSQPNTNSPSTNLPNTNLIEKNAIVDDKAIHQSALTESTPQEKIEQTQTKDNQVRQDDAIAVISSNKTESQACSKLNEAILLSMPGSKQQNDKKALLLLKELKQSQSLSDDDQRFNNMLLLHVSQRQKLRNMIGLQDQRLKQTETQLNQLKNLEVEIDKKERSVSSPVEE